MCGLLNTARYCKGGKLPWCATQAVYFETTAAGGVSWEEVQEAQLKGGEGGSERRSRRKLKISIPKWCGKWVVPMDEYRDGVVGAKSKNLAGAHGSAPGVGTIPYRVSRTGHHAAGHVRSSRTLDECCSHQSRKEPHMCQHVRDLCQ